jgi:phage repressor protein C with HTH and peptisase S24 domain
MLTHSQIWAAIDALAARESLTPSSLAKLAGLDPTTFNRSKRQNSEGQFRWPSTESIAKVLAATGATVDEFLLMISHAERPMRRVPFRILTKKAENWFDQAGALASGWDEIAFPSTVDHDIFAVEIKGHQFAPVFRDGDVIIVDPKAQPRRGDRVFLLDTAGAIRLATLGRQTTTHLHLTTLQDEALEPQALESIKMVARIVWVSQ